MSAPTWRLIAEKGHPESHCLFNGRWWALVVTTWKKEIQLWKATAYPFGGWERIGIYPLDLEEQLRADPECYLMEELL